MTHLEDIQMTYFEHMGGAMKYTCLSVYAACVFCIHAIFPEYLVFEGSQIIENLHNELFANKLKCFSAVNQSCLL
jgi:hypothetical protein